jgi:Protein of unknown function (DUF3237)
VSRKYFLDKELLYLFSYNTEIEPFRHKIGVVSGGARFNVDITPGEARVYHVLREKSEGGLSQSFKVITGTLEQGSGRALYRTDDVLADEIRLTIETDDGALIGSRYKALAYLGPGGYEAYVEGIDKVGTEKKPVQAPLVITPRYETESEKYKWIMDYQCVGFGRAQVIKNEVRRVTYDIYAMT